MEPSSGVIFVIVMALISVTIIFVRASEKIEELEEKVDDLQSDILILEIREMNLKDELKDAMTEADFLYS